MEGVPPRASLFALAFSSTHAEHSNVVRKFLLKRELESWARIPVPTKDADWKADAAESDNATESSTRDQGTPREKKRSRRQVIFDSEDELGASHSINQGLRSFDEDNEDDDAMSLVQQPHGDAGGHNDTDEDIMTTGDERNLNEESDDGHDHGEAAQTLADKTNATEGKTVEANTVPYAAVVEMVCNHHREMSVMADTIKKLREELDNAVRKHADDTQNGKNELEKAITEFKIVAGRVDGHDRGKDELTKVCVRAVRAINLMALQLGANEPFPTFANAYRKSERPTDKLAIAMARDTKKPWKQRFPQGDVMRQLTPAANAPRDPTPWTPAPRTTERPVEITDNEDVNAEPPSARTRKRTGNTKPGDRPRKRVAMASTQDSPVPASSTPLVAASKPAVSSPLAAGSHISADIAAFFSSPR